MNVDYVPPLENAVAAIRVSSVKQGTDGDSPEAQREQIEQFALRHNFKIKKFFVFLESASKEQQPIQEAIDYCKNLNNDIQVFIIKSIDRFTRGGSYFYDSLKMQLERNGVRLVDIYGIIGARQVNTLEHLGVEFSWSVYSPTKKAELLEAERSKDELRDIMSRMIGAEIRYSRMGYWVRRPPFGFDNKRVETLHGKRTVLIPHPHESRWIIKMFELRCKGHLNDHQIVDEVNKLGFKTRVQYMRSKRDRTQILKEKGGKPLTIKMFWQYIQNPIYAGINYVNWTKGCPHKGHFDGLVSIEQFNQANRGKITVVEQEGKIEIYKGKPPEYLLNKGARNADFPYKKYVLCPHCQKPLYGSASRGKLGKYYPAYHCNSRGHYYRIPKKDFDQTITNFIRSIQLAPGYTKALTKAVIEEWERRNAEKIKDQDVIDVKIQELEDKAKNTAKNLMHLSSHTMIKYMEDEVNDLEEKIAALKKKKAETNSDKKEDIRLVMKYIEYFLEHLEKLLIDPDNPESAAALFAVLFDMAPTYQEIQSGTPQLSQYIALNEVFKVSEGQLAGGQGFEPQ